MKWGILGAAKFAQDFMGPAIHAANGAELAALATSDAGKAAPFQAFAPGLQVYDSYDALLAAPEIEAVYVPLPNHLHVEWTLKALAAGKHVLCEKPLALTAGDFDALIEARDSAGRLAAEAFMIVHHPQFVRARDLVQSGAVGELRHVEAVFSYNNDGDTSNIRRDASKGGGGLPDIGVYTFGAARFVTGAEPDQITHAKLLWEDGVDTFAQVAAEFPGFTYGAVVSMRMHNRQEIVFHGSSGVLRLTCPFNAAVHDQAELVLDDGKHSRRVERWPGVNHYVLQVEAFERAASGQESYACPLEFSRGTQQMMDMVFEKAGPQS